MDNSYNKEEAAAFFIAPSISGYPTPQQSGAYLLNNNLFIFYRVVIVLICVSIYNFTFYLDFYIFYKINI